LTFFQSGVRLATDPLLQDPSMSAHAPTARPAPAAPLGAAFRRLVASSAASNLADGLVKVGLPLLAARLTRSPALVAGVAVAAGLPWLVAALHAGALADRLDRRWAMVGANLVRLVVLAVLAATIAGDLATIWLLYAVAFALGLAETLFDTSAQSLLPRLVDRSQLSRANGRLYAVELSTNQFAGPPIGSALVAVSLALAFVAPAGLFLLAAAVLATLPGHHRAERAAGRTTLTTDIAEGLRFLWGHRLLRTTAWMVGAMNLIMTMGMSVLVLYVVGPASPVGLTEALYGVLLTAFAVGSLVGSLTAERIERRLGRAWSLRLAVLTAAVAAGVPAVTTSPWLLGAGFVVGGAGIMVWNVIVVSFRQRVTPDRLLGRVNAGFRLLAWGTMPLGGLLGGLLGELVGLRAVFAVGGLAGLLLLLVRITDAELAAAEAAAEEPVCPR
jgi:MFS family permease